MKIEKVGDDGKVYVFNKNFWTGKLNITVDGVPTKKVNRKTFRTADGKTITVKGNFITSARLEVSVKLEISEQSSLEQVVLFKNAWYEVLLILLPCLIASMGVIGVGGGMSPLNAGLSGGAAGALAVGGGMVNALFVFRTKLNKPLKAIISLAVFAAAAAAWFGIYVAIVGGINYIFPMF
jgi:hypothetical protein